ncbi:autotransporter outer membrane beta-barrel domain-containing protein [Pantoea sp. KPR_PJ]|uniref:autotransporter outer membrane beta-barrel domain-containing protein n=1 Tax=Pantoea sp. KPR_PJ TaxID=2738375 RepID=UPI003527A30D
MNNKFELSMLAKALIIACGLGAWPGVGQTAMTGSQRGSDITLEDGTMLIADKDIGTLYGILVPLTMTGKVDAGTDSTISVNGPDVASQGIVVRGPESTLTANNLKLNVTGLSAVGIDLLGKYSQADLGSDTSVSVTGTRAAHGITVGFGSSLKANRLNVFMQGDRGHGVVVTGYGSNANIGQDGVIKTDGHNSHGVQVDALVGVEADGPASFAADALTVNTLGEASNAINVQSDSIACLGSHTTLITNGDNAAAIFSMGKVTADHIAISTSGTYSMGIEAREESDVTIGAGSVVASKQSGTLVAMDDSATINFLGSQDERNTLFSSGSYAVSAQSTGATVNLYNTDIRLETTGGAGIWSLLGGMVNGDGVTLTASSGNNGVLAMAGGQVNLVNDLTIDMGAPEEIAIGTPYYEGYAPGIVTAEGKMAINGSVVSNDGLIDLNFAPGSLWRGSAVSGHLNDGHLNVSLTDSEWQVASSSGVDNLQLNNALIDLSAATDTRAFSTLTIASLSGRGDFRLRTNIAGEGDGNNSLGDKIVVTGKSAGEYGLTILNQGSAATTGNEVLTVVETSDGIATFKGNSDVELGAYVYTVNKQGTNWVLSSPGIDDHREAEVNPEETPSADTPDRESSVTPDRESSVTPDPDSGVTPDRESSVTPDPDSSVTPDPDSSVTPDPDSSVTPDPDSGVTPDPDSSVTPGEETPVPDEKPERADGPTPAASDTSSSVITSTADAGANFLNIGYLMNYAETQTLLQRMGDIRQGQTTGNVWLRGVSGRFNSFAHGKLSDFNMNYSGYQFGVDKRVAENVPVSLGLFMGVTEASPRYQSGKGTTKSEHAGAYATWFNEAGFYLDGLVKINRLRNQFSVSDTQANRISGNGVSSGMSASLEAGKRFRFSDGTNGFYLEPQFQMTAGRQGGSRIRATNGLTVYLAGYRSLQGRTSVLAGYEINQRDYRLNTYVKTGLLREFKGNARYALNGSPEKMTFKGNGWNNGVGISAQRKNHTFFLEADLTGGERFNHRQVNAGYRFSF